MKKLFETGRPNKLANGFCLNDDRHRKNGKQRISNHNHPDFNKRGNYHDVLALNVRGTTDVLGRANWLQIKKVMKPHPTDRGYFKEVYVLSEAGKRRYREALRKFLE